MYRPLALLTALVFASPAAASVAVSGGSVTFRHAAKGASSVHVAGSFNGWKLDKAMTDPDGDGTFELRLDLAPGKHLYKFVVDGRWTHDPENDATEADGHGGFNSVVTGKKGRQVTGGEKPAKGSSFGSTSVRKDVRVFTGEVFFIPKDTKKLPDLGRLKPHGKIFTEVFDIAPRKFSEGFPGLSDRYEWFAIRYRGTFRVPKTGKYRFRLLSDDGARFYLNGKLCLDNDGLHGPKSVSRIVRLKKGDHELVLDYMQGPALEVALQLFVTKPLSTTEVPVKATSKPIKEEEKKKKKKSRRRRG